MTQPPPPPHPPATRFPTLEVVRGAQPGRRYPLTTGSVILGSGPVAGDDATMICLAEQEGASPRKMAARHLALVAAGPAGAIRLTDLASPGGTFVNSRRVLDGSPVDLKDGDLIQLGGVVLRVVQPQGSIAPPPASVEFLYRSSASSTVCRNWDDFLTFSAQRWEELRTDLIDGRIAAFATAIGRPDLAPAADRASPTAAQADLRLDAWLARLPTTADSGPELDVHPLRVAIAAASGGVTVPGKVRVANVGHRLLRVRVAVAPAGGVTVTLRPDCLDRELIIRDSRDVAFEVAVPDPFEQSATAELVISGAGESKRVAIRIDRKLATTHPDYGGAPPADRDPTAIPGPVAGFLALPIGRRMTIAALVGLATRLVVALAGGAIGIDTPVTAGSDFPRLGGVVLAFAAFGLVLGAGLVARRFGRGDALAGGVAGAGLGALLAAVSVALCRSFEPALGPWADSPVVVIGAWAVLGAIGACLIPRSRPPETEQNR